MEVHGPRGRGATVPARALQLRVELHELLVRHQVVQVHLPQCVAGGFAVLN